MDLSKFTNMRDICGEIPNGNKQANNNNNERKSGKEKNLEFFRVTVSIEEKETVIIINYQGGIGQAVTCELYDPQDNLVATQAMEAGQARIVLTDAQLWSPADPVLYTLLINTEAEQYYYQTGIYEQTIENGKIFVNHIWYSVMGVLGCDTETTELGEMSEASVRLQMIRMRQNGINALFLEKGKTYPNWISELADEEGILLLHEGDLGNERAPRWKDYYPIIEHVNGMYESLKGLLWNQNKNE
jgi:beta-galactosidase/beta-glucuronidase